MPRLDIKNTNLFFVQGKYRLSALMASLLPPYAHPSYYWALLKVPQLRHEAILDPGLRLVGKEYLLGDLELNHGRLSDLLAHLGLEQLYHLLAGGSYDWSIGGLSGATYTAV